MHDRFKGYKHVYITQIKKHGCWCLRHIQEGILALIIANNEVDFGDDEAILIEYILSKKDFERKNYASFILRYWAKEINYDQSSGKKNLMIGIFILWHQ